MTGYNSRLLLCKMKGPVVGFFVDHLNVQSVSCIHMQFLLEEWRATAPLSRSEEQVDEKIEQHAWNCDACKPLAVAARLESA